MLESIILAIVEFWVGVACGLIWMILLTSLAFNIARDGTAEPARLNNT